MISGKLAELEVTGAAFHIEEARMRLTKAVLVT
jgi:hypothetical protein